MKKALIKGLILCVIIAGVGVGGYYGYNKYKASKTTVTANSYITLTATKRNIQVSIQGTGSVFAAVSKDIVASNNGTLSGLSVNLGDSVKKGVVLCNVNSDQLQQAVDKANDNLQKLQLQLASAKTEQDIAMQNLGIDSAQRDLNTAIAQRDAMTLTSPIDGVIIAKNYNNGDDIPSGKAVLSVIDPTSMKIKVAVDELDIAKVAVGQSASITFGAIKDKTFQGTVETISPTGTTSNNVTTYDVTVSLKDTTGVKLGMNANVNILTASKDNALVIPAEALVERNNRKYVMIPSSSSTSTTNTSSNQNNTYASNSNSNSNSTNSNSSGNSGTGKSYRNGNGGPQGYALSSAGRLVEIKTGLENENYIEVTDGITEGQKLLVQLPKTSTSTNTNSMRSSFGGGFGGSYGGFGGGNSGNRTQSQSNNGKN